MKKYFLPFFAVLLILSCTPAKQAIENGGAYTGEGASPKIDTTSAEIDLAKYRSKLSDTYSSQTNEIPSAFKRIKIDDGDTDLFSGYRVQIYSGTEVASADSTAAQFKKWSEANISGYQAETYVFFKTPYYRVHVGDFHKKNKAIYFSNIVKRKFNDAWVVYDRVNPWNVPADTVEIEILSKSDK